MRLFDLIETRILTEEGEEYGEYLVHSENLDYFLAGLEKINKKAGAIGVPPLTIVSREREVTAGHVSFRIKVQGEPVRIKGWEFVATLEHNASGSNVIRGVPGYDPIDLKNYLKSPHTNCDFCHSKRDRNHTYVIKNDKGEFKQVGGQCLKKFLGDAAQKLVRFSFGMPTLLGSLNDREDTGGKSARRGPVGMDTQTVLATAAASIRLNGFKKADSWDSTASFVRAAMFDYSPPGYDDLRQRDASVAHVDAIKHPTQEDQTQAQAAINWFNNDVSDGDKEASSYLFSLKTIIGADFVTAKSVGLLVSLIPVHMREQAKLQQQVPAADRPAPPLESQYIGKIAEKIPPTQVKINYVQHVDTQFGLTQLVKAVDQQGNLLTWFNGKRDLDNNDNVTITATVKKHEEYKGKKSTLLTRVKVV